jgi:hypothetical protein
MLIVVMLEGLSEREKEGLSEREKGGGIDVGSAASIADGPSLSCKLVAALDG